jgi:hypothetical protein
MIRDAGELFSPEEKAYMDRVNSFDKIVAAFGQALPGDLCDTFLKGNTGPMFAAAKTHFVDDRLAHMFLLACLSVRSASVENWLDDDIGVSATLRVDEAAGMPFQFFRSPAFLGVLESAILFVRMIEGQLLFDPELKWNHFALFMGTLKIGGLNLAVWKLHRQFQVDGEMAGISRSETIQDMAVWDGLDHDVHVIARHLEVMGKKFRGYGAWFCSSDPCLDEPNF